MMLLYMMTILNIAMLAVNFLVRADAEKMLGEIKKWSFGRTEMKK